MRAAVNARCAGATLGESRGLARMPLVTRIREHMAGPVKRLDCEAPDTGRRVGEPLPTGITLVITTDTRGAHVKLKITTIGNSAGVILPK